MKRGFTLIEMIAVLVLVGITGVFAGHLISVTIRNYFLGAETARLSQQSVVAHQRIIREINWAQPGSLANPDAGTLTWISAHPDRTAEGQQTLAYSGGSLVLNSEVLLPEVSTFSINLGPDHVELDIDGWNARLYPRLNP